MTTRTPRGPAAIMLARLERRHAKEIKAMTNGMQLDVPITCTTCNHAGILHRGGTGNMWTGHCELMPPEKCDCTGLKVSDEVEAAYQRALKAHRNAN